MFASLTQIVLEMLLLVQSFLILVKLFEIDVASVLYKQEQKLSKQLMKMSPPMCAALCCIEELWRSW